jgi:predicted phosphodiesterase
MSSKDAEPLDKIKALLLGGESVSSIARTLNVHRTYVYRILKRNGLTPEALRPTLYPDNIALERDGDALVLNAKGRVKTLESLLKEAQIDTSKWRVSKWTANKWDAMTKGGDTVAMWQVKAYLDRIPDFARFVLEPVKSISRSPGRGNAQNLQRALIIPDSQNGYRVDRKTNEHDPLHDRRAWDLAIQAAQKLQPEYIIMLGDMLDLAPFGTYLTEPSLSYTTMPTLLELLWWCAQLRLAAPSAKIYYLEGNHEKRLYKQLIGQLSEAVELRPVDDHEGPPSLSVKRLLALDSLDIEYLEGYPSAELWLWDKVRVYHGDRVRSGSGATTASLIKEANSSVVFGHIHRLEMCAKTVSKAEGQETLFAMSPGCLCRLDGVIPGSTQRSNWQQGLGIINLLPATAVRDSVALCEIIPIKEGRCVIEGSVYHGDPHVEAIRKATGYEWF